MVWLRSPRFCCDWCPIGVTSRTAGHDGWHRRDGAGWPTVSSNETVRAEDCGNLWMLGHPWPRITDATRTWLGLESPNMRQLLGKTKFVSLGSYCVLTLMKGFQNGYGSIPIHTIFRGMNIHLPAILMFTRGTRFWHTNKCSLFMCENLIGPVKFLAHLFCSFIFQACYLTHVLGTGLTPKQDT